MSTRLIIADAWKARLAGVGLCAYEDFVNGRAGEPVERSRTTEIRRMPLSPTPSKPTGSTATGGVTVYLKVYRYAGLRYRPWFLQDKAAVEAENLRLLRERCGVPTPDVIAQGARTTGLWWQDAFIMTLAVPGAVSLEERLSVQAASSPGCSSGRRDARCRLLLESADLVARMHAAGFFHMDLQGRNLLVSDGPTTGPSEQPTIYLIDSPRGGLHGSALRQAHGRLRDLSSLYKTAQTHLSRTEQVRWLRRYLGVPRLSSADRVLIQGVLYDRRVKEE